MAARTDAERLELVLEAIDGTLLRNASAMRSATGRHIASLPMPDLLALRKDLEARVATAAGTARPLVLEFRPPS